jgi:hypothetical protein
MDTKVTLDQGAYLEPSLGARFGGGGVESPCLGWASGDLEPKWIDGRRGTSLDAYGQQGALVSCRAFFRAYLAMVVLDDLGGSTDGVDSLTYGEAKRRGSEAHLVARESLLGPDGPFSAWLVMRRFSTDSQRCRH